MKCLTITRLTCMTMVRVAAQQYQFGLISAANNDFRDTTGKFAAFADRGGAFGIQNALHFNQASYLYLEIGKGEPGSFGAYLLDGYQVAREYSLAAVGNGFYTVMENGRPVQFQTGDAIGFWITDMNGNRIYNTPRLAGGHTATYNGTQMTDGGTTYANGFGQFGQFIGSSSYDKMYADSTYVLDIMVGSEAPAGQPLPGILATLLLGGSGIILMSFKRKKTSID